MNNSVISIRLADPSDLTEIQKMFVDTISVVCKDDYSPEQIRVWTSTIENTQHWTDKLLSQYFVIAELANRMVGFASLENNDYFDFLYVHKDYQRKGIANRLYAVIEKEAKRRKSTILNSDVSETARRFFEKKGFKTVAPQIKKINGVEIRNYKMTKSL